jgi:hypothetical protein
MANSAFIRSIRKRLKHCYKNKQTNCFVSTNTRGRGRIVYVIEQMVTSGGILVPSFHQQFVFTIEEYPQELLRKSKDRFLEMIDFLDEQLK